MTTSLVGIAGLDAATAPEVIAKVAARLIAAGHVAPSFEQAAIARERRSPTGLPFEPDAVAIPHAEPEHVTRPAIAIATLVKPVSFRQMGTPAVKLSARLVVMPALTASDQAASGLTPIIEALQDRAFRDELLACGDDAAIVAAAGRRWSAR